MSLLASSLVAIAGAVPARGDVLHEALDSAALGGRVRIVAVTPDGYGRGGRYPLVLVLHGLSGSEQTWLDADKGDMVGLAHRAPAVYLTFDGGKGFYSDWYNGGRRGTPAYERFVLDELLPFARRRFRLAGGRANRTVIGASMGGFGALLLAERRPDVFGRAISLSGFIQPQRPTTYPGLQAAGVDAEQIWGPSNGPYLAGHNPTKLVGNLRGVKLYVAAGDGVPTGAELSDAGGAGLLKQAVDENEVRAQAEEFVGAARGAGLDLTWRPRHGVHGWTAWRRDLDDVLRWGVSGAVAPKPSSWSYDTVAQQGRAWNVGFRFSEPPSTVARLELQGETLTVRGAGRVALRVFRCVFEGALPLRVTLPRRCLRRRP